MTASTLDVRFAGWFQVRLATDPDTTDEPRGVSGYSFALPGEPDLDRVIRFQRDGTTLRTGSPMVTPSTFGVSVTDVAVRGVAVPHHPLVGAAVSLPPTARFEMRNYVLTDGEAGTECIHPFGLRFESTAGRPLLARDDVLYPPDPDATLWDVPVAWLKRRGGKFQPAPEVFQQVTGFDDPVAYREARLAELRRLRADPANHADEVTRAALDRRIEQFVAYGADDRRTYALTFSEHRQFDLNGPITCDQTSLRDIDLDASFTWPMELTLAVWDADLLCGWASGQLSVPLAPSTDAAMWTR